MEVVKITEDYMSTKPAPGTCCPDNDYESISFYINIKDELWELFRCQGCGSLQKKFLIRHQDIKTIKE